MEPAHFKSETVKTRDAQIYYEMRGEGPFLLIIQGGGGDADLTNELVAQLTDKFTVITYDRRGLSRSKPNDHAAVPNIHKHAVDAHFLIKHISPEPIFVFATSIGTLIALDLLSRYPQDIQLMLVHEPTIVTLLSREESNTINRKLMEIESIFNTQGFNPALKSLSSLIGVHPDDRETGTATVNFSLQQVANLSYYFRYDVGPGRTYTPDLEKLKLQNKKLSIAIGKTADGLWTHRAARALAKRLQTEEVIEFPGGHNGPTAYPKAFAKSLSDFFCSIPETL